VFPVVIGSTFISENAHEFSIGNFSYSFEGNAKSSFDIDKRKGIVDAAFIYLNAPYLWGGKSPFGIDCSGFTQMVYKLNGLKLLRDAKQQATQGTVLNFVEEALPGDLAFFDNDEGNIIHVGIVLGNNKIIHASGCVRVDEFDHQGIFNADKKNYTHNLRLLKTIL
jgi:cell wall-associated NlpC family hydrolase